ncbi:MAG: large conductance mechanosensitive channel protein MscL [Bryobacteraceae bacterium]
MGMIQEFKEFAVKGNMLDMAVGIIMGAAFGGVVSGLVGDVVMPVAGFFTGGADFKDWFIPLSGSFATLEEAKKAGAPVIAYGAWLNTVINFLIVAFVMYMIVRAMNRMKKEEEAAPAAPPKEEVLLTEIRDLLSRNRAAAAGD